MRRVAGAMLFGLGLLCVIAAAALAWLIVPRLKQIPYAMKPPDVVLNAPGATFVSVGTLPGGAPTIAVKQGTLRNTTGVKPDYKAAAGLTGTLAGKTLIWNVYQATDSVDDNVPINRSESRIALNRVSGAAVTWAGQCYNDVKVGKQDPSVCAPGNIAYTGQLYLFPFGTQKKTYQYFDGTLRKAMPMTYEGEEKVAGLSTYRFQQTVPQQNLDVDHDTLTGLLGFLAPKAKTGTMNYEASRTLWVEPMTGAIVAYTDREHRQLVPADGQPIDILDATFRYDKATGDTIVDQARTGRAQLLLFGRYLPIGLLVVGLVAMVAGAMITRRAAVPARHAASEVPAPEASAVPQG
ncbi:DUF3068 domain-containing protein [Actinoplanes sp. KI2]|uniref:DUF3068 domain-containing protein n=1 Tax=Actinoplanes sp. KI2 TaxID=2983315 RepID=UPI0021D5F83E|nr:DUF3068 domain-containing protein [Actinoplanes sp. KI2]MCU7728044.1 DUF3068 domain-containing protein [Actinoplanes sp. KI2]